MDSADITHRDLAVLSSAGRPFDRADWIFELKYDGFRVLAKTRPEPVMLSRNGRDMTYAFPELVRELAALPDCVIDGELTIIDKDGLPLFDRLQRRALMSKKITVDDAAQQEPAAIMAFDLLMLKGKDLRRLPLLRRKEMLEHLVEPANRIVYVQHIGEQGVRLYAKAAEMGVEGIVAKRADSTYVAGRTQNWVKIKTPAGREREAKRYGKSRH